MPASTGIYHLCPLFRSRILYDNTNKSPSPRGIGSSGIRTADTLYLGSLHHLAYFAFTTFASRYSCTIHAVYLLKPGWHQPQCWLYCQSRSLHWLQCGFWPYIHLAANQSPFARLTVHSQVGWSYHGRPWHSHSQTQDLIT